MLGLCRLKGIFYIFFRVMILYYEFNDKIEWFLIFLCQFIIIKRNSNVESPITNDFIKYFFSS